MSTRKGNDKKKGQKYQNTSAFRNDLFNTSKKAKTINSLQVGNVCCRCKEIIEWKIKFKKYKARTCPGKCLKCEQKTVKYAYHKFCTECALEKKVCAKCGEEKDIILGPETDPKVKQMELSQLDNGLKSMSLRERRTFLRQLEKENSGKGASGSKTSKSRSHLDEDGDFESIDDEESNEESEDEGELVNT